MKYRKEIDGLRAIAVLWVFLFHLDFGFIPGGFVGVDIFYVISGFVIFRGLLREQANGSVSIAKFYKRRVRRILPAVVLTVAASLAIGAAVLTPHEFAQLAKSAIASLFSVSNFYFNEELSYFADAAYSIPLLHTWSLGVEEQFYLLAPFLILLVGRKWKSKGVAVVLASLTGLSFLYALLALYVIQDENHAFYLPMGRFWEIGVGGLLAYMEPRLVFKRTVATSLMLLGAAGIIGSGTWITEQMPFPGYVALLPVLSTALLIAAGGTAGTGVKELLQTRPMRFLGDISFSLYLFHWPAIVFTGLYLSRPLADWEKLLVLGVCIGLSSLSLRLLETPFRNASSLNQWPKVRNGIVAGIAACLVAAMAISMLDGVPQRLPTEARVLNQEIEQANYSQSNCVPIQRLKAPPKARICSFSGELLKYDFLLWGDSHAGMLAPVISKNMQAEGYHGLVASLPGCHALYGSVTSRRKNREACLALTQQIVNMIKDEKIPLVIMADRWANLSSLERSPGDGSQPELLFDALNGERPANLADALSRTVAAISDQGAKLLIIGPVPEVGFHVPAALIRHHLTGQPLPQNHRYTFDKRQHLVLSSLKDLQQAGHAVYYPHQHLCDAHQCQIEQNNQPLYRDDDHLNDLGVEALWPSLRPAVLPPS